MSNEAQKDFNAVLRDSKGMPKFQTITDAKSIQKYGGTEAQREALEGEGRTVIQKGRKHVEYYIKDYEKFLFDLHGQSM